MSGFDLSNAVVIVHPALTPITDAALEEALAPAPFKPTTTHLRFAETKQDLAALADADWPRLSAELDAESARLHGALASSAGDIFYFGMAPIAIAIELGRRIGSTRRLRAFQQRHDTKSWRWPRDEQTVTAELAGVPREPMLAKGDVVIRVGCSHAVSEEDTRSVVPYAIGELSVAVPAPHEDVLQSEQDVIAVAAKFGEALDVVTRFYPNADAVHVFASVPSALAVRMGAEINPTIHAKPIQTYQFAAGRRPRYVRALLIGERARQPLDEEGRTVAAAGRAAFARSIAALQALTELEVPRDAWLPHLLGGAAAELPRQLSALGPLGKNRAVVGAIIGSETEVPGGEFRFDTEARRWCFDDQLLCALGRRLSVADVETAGRLFLLHEAIHVAEQALTTATAERVGRLPRILEEVDYIADVWALLHDYVLALRGGTVEATSAPAFFRDRLRVMTAAMWAFDAADLPLRTIQVRRLNRYLIWYWLRLSLEGADDLAGCLRLLAQKPVLEISGPRTALSSGRVVFDLDPIYFEDLELGVFAEGYRLVRIGDRAGARVRALVDALRLGDEPGFVAALRGVFDSAAGAH